VEFEEDSEELDDDSVEFEEDEDDEEDELDSTSFPATPAPSVPTAAVFSSWTRSPETMLNIKKQRTNTTIFICF
jgi:hypothetical protein